ncbi:hypothetical protein KR018_005209 [Drosophila ironensis]|nr:hypothetical protein KR018_005209 [Drosophila ironensis]
MANKAREAMLAALDLVFIDSLLPQGRQGLDTTQRAHYKDLSKEMTRAKSAYRYQTDPAVISGHYANNLKVDGMEMKTRTWPRAMDWREEYKHFVKRNKWCNEEIYKLFFVNPPVQYKDVEEYFKDLMRTTYMSDYSPSVYTSLHSQHTSVLNKPGKKTDGIDYQTTYGNYHNRIQEENLFKETLYELKPKEMSLTEFKNAMRKYFKKYGVSTYYEEICLPALLMAKNEIMPSGHIDRYTLRK